MKNIILSIFFFLLINNTFGQGVVDSICTSKTNIKDKTVNYTLLSGRLYYKLNPVIFVTPLFPASISISLGENIKLRNPYNFPNWKPGYEPPQSRNFGSLNLLGNYNLQYVDVLGNKAERHALTTEQEISYHIIRGLFILARSKIRK